MEKNSQGSRKTVKGIPSAILLSVLIHGALFFLAGMLVVFTVVKKTEKKFVPPKAVERPKMKLRKPKVKVRKSAKPRPSTRIVTKVKLASMPDIQLPEMSGMGGKGLGGGVEGFDLMPDFSEINILGSGQSIGNDFEGTFYDFKRDHSGRPIPMDQHTFAEKLTKFVKKGWDTSLLSRYCQSPKKLYATCFMIPTTKSNLGPRAFGEDTGGWCWVIHYKGSLVYPEDLKIRFWGYGDDILLVRVNGELVLNANYHRDGVASYITTIGGSWDSSSSDDARYWYGTNKARVGDWIELKAGQPIDMEVLIGEVPGGNFSAMLTVQIDGEEYETNRQGGPILPMFKTAEPSRSLQDIILSELIRGEASVTNGPVFRDYKMPKIAVADEAAPANDAPAVSAPSETKKTKWKCLDDTIVEGEYVAVIGDKLVLKPSTGRQLKIPVSALSPADRTYLELETPPSFKVEFTKLTRNDSNRYKQSPSEMEWGWLPPRVNDYTFGAKVRQTGINPYPHELTIEHHAIGKERVGDKYILLDRQSRTFILNKENNRRFAFTGEPIEFLEFTIEEMENQLRGRRPSDNIVILKDKRGRILEHSTSKSWLWENLDRLQELPIGAYMDKQCNRTYPTSPKPSKW